MDKIKALIERLLKMMPEDADVKSEDIFGELDDAVSELTAGGGASEALQRQNKDFLKEIKTLKERLRSDHGGDAAKVSELEDQIKEQKLEYESRLQKVATEGTIKAGRLEKELKKAQEGFATVQSAHSRSVLDKELTETLLAGKVPVEHFPALKALLSQGAQVTVEGDTAKAAVNGKPLTEHVTEFLASEAGKHYVRAPGSAGGGAGGSQSGGNRGAVKTASRSDLAAMSPTDQIAFAKAGGTVTD